MRYFLKPICDIGFSISLSLFLGFYASERGGINDIIQLMQGVNATNILAMTFTTAAAAEMKDRVGVHVGKLTSKELNVCTFHSFCLQLCRTHAEK